MVVRGASRRDGRPGRRCGFDGTDKAGFDADKSRDLRPPSWSKPTMSADSGGRPDTTLMMVGEDPRVGLGPSLPMGQSLVDLAAGLPAERFREPIGSTSSDALDPSRRSREARRKMDAPKAPASAPAVGRPPEDVPQSVVEVVETLPQPGVAVASILGADPRPTPELARGRSSARFFLFAQWTWNYRSCRRSPASVVVSGG